MENLEQITEPVSFDDIEGVTASEPSSDNGLQDVATQTEEQPNEPVEAAAPEATEEGVEEAPAQEAKEDGKEDEIKPVSESPESLPAAVEAIDGTRIPESTVFRKKVDGKPVDFTIKQAIDEYTGKLAIQPRFAEANKLKQKAEHLHSTTTKQLNEAKDLINAFFTHTKNGEHRDAIAALTKFTGGDADKEWQSFQQLQADNFKKITEMSPEQLREAQLKEENEYYRRQVERAQADKKADIEKAEIEGKIAESTTKWGIDRGTFEEGYAYLLDMKNKNEYNGPIDVATCAEAGWDIRTWQAIDAVVEKELPDRKGDNTFYLEVLNDTKKYGLKQEDWMKILSDAKKTAPTDTKVSPASASNLERKKAKNAPLAKSKDVKSSRESSPEFWDEI